MLKLISNRYIQKILVAIVLFLAVPGFCIMSLSAVTQYPLHSIEGISCMPDTWVIERDNAYIPFPTNVTKDDVEKFLTAMLPIRD